MPDKNYYSYLYIREMKAWLSVSFLQIRHSELSATVSMTILAMCFTGTYMVAIHQRIDCCKGEIDFWHVAFWAVNLVVDIRWVRSRRRLWFHFVFLY